MNIPPIPSSPLTNDNAWRKWFIGLQQALLRANKMYTVANLPVNVPRGTEGYAIDALSPTFLSVVSGGGTTMCPVFFNGTAWIVG